MDRPFPFLRKAVPALVLWAVMPLLAACDPALACWPAGSFPTCSRISKPPKRTAAFIPEYDLAFKPTLTSRVSAGGCAGATWASVAPLRHQHMRSLGKGQCAQGPFVEKVEVPCDRPPRSLGVSEWNSSLHVNALKKGVSKHLRRSGRYGRLCGGGEGALKSLTVYRISDLDSDRFGNDARSKEFGDGGRR